MNTIYSVARSFPFCQNMQCSQEKALIVLRTIAVATVAIAAIAEGLALLNELELNLCGITVGPPIFLGIVLIVIGGAFLRCIKRVDGANTMINARPLVVPSFKETQEISEELLDQFDSLQEGSHLWVGAEKMPITIEECAGRGGSKRAWEISEDEVLMLPNDVVA